MKTVKSSDFSIKVSGEMTKEDAGKVAIINAWRELLSDVIGHAVVKIVIAFTLIWKGGELSHTIIKYYFN